MSSDKPNLDKFLLSEITHGVNLLKQEVLMKKLGRINHIKDNEFYLENQEGENFKINQTSAYIWKLADGTRNKSEIIDKISQVGEIDSQAATAVVEYVIQELKKVQLITEDNIEACS